MTKDEALKLALEALERMKQHSYLRLDYAEQAITAIKEALAQPEQKPAATLAVRWHPPVGKVAYVLEVDLPIGIHKLYASPPQRQWVELTYREMMDAIGLDDTPMESGRKIEAKLKEKNA